MNGNMVERDNQIILPFNKDQFAGFITSLLGRPQTIQQRFAFPFEVATNDIKDTFHLVEQRVHDQNSANLVQFTVDVSYNDGSTITHSCLEDFLNYKEVKSLIPSSITLAWTYLITFQNRTTPEKQEIEISFINHASHFSPEYSYEEVDAWFSHSVGMITVLVHHTSRSWGTDIESLLINHLETYKKTESKYRKHCRKNSSNISLMYLLSMIFLCIVAFCISKFKIEESMKAEAVKVTANGTAALSERIDFIIHYLVKSNSTFEASSSLFFFAVFIMVILGAGVLGGISKFKEPSFILTSKTAEKHKLEVLSKLSKTWTKYFLVISGGLISGVVSNIIFTLIWLP